MNKRAFRRIAVFASAAALTGGAVAGCGSDAATTNGTTQQQQNGQPPQGGGMDFSALATELGVSTAKLQAAMQKFMPQPGEQGQRPSGGSPGDMAANLAKELGLSESKVKAALEKVMPQGGPPNGGQAPPSGTPSAATTS
ncbi:hypothetical protein [Solirubrobacter soli]|uniref:hypothetical protein n=1 Tax=Solirubrobacter soli TaxID=363832 RepID=UPI0004269868|nr:hypothetical protein [Solirubrobacter soli]